MYCVFVTLDMLLVWPGILVLRPEPGNHLPKAHRITWLHAKCMHIN